MVPRVDMCEETRDDGRRLLAPSVNPSSPLPGNFNVVYWSADLYSIFFYFRFFWFGILPVKKQTFVDNINIFWRENTYVFTAPGCASGKIFVFSR